MGGRGSGSRRTGRRTGGGIREGTGAPMHPDFPARINAITGGRYKSPEETLKAFREKHVFDNKESLVIVDDNGFVYQYNHGGKGSVGFVPSAVKGLDKKNMTTYHNHPNGSHFSRRDLYNIHEVGLKGVVASTTHGDYIFTAGNGFKGAAFNKALRQYARKLNQAKDLNEYNKLMDKFLKDNQKKFKYKYSYNKQ